jgi:non-ribosomal peptide synthase protein (TIGR01720 family)
LRILLEDFLKTYFAQAAGVDGSVLLGRKTSSFGDWTSAVEDAAMSALPPGGRGYWWTPAYAEAFEFEGTTPQAQSTWAAVTRLEYSLDSHETRQLLRRATQSLRAQPLDLLLATLAHSLEAHSGSAVSRVWLEGHGRVDPTDGCLDVSRTVGWFTALFPVLLHARETVAETTDGVKAMLRAVPDGGAGYGMARYLREEDLPAPSGLGFNFHGSAGDVVDYPGVEIVREGRATWHPSVARRRGLGVDVSVRNEQLFVTWAFAPDAHDPAVVAAVAQDYLARLKAAAKDPLRRTYRPEDFPLARLSQGVLDKLTARFAHPGDRSL